MRRFIRAIESPLRRAAYTKRDKNGVADSVKSEKLILHGNTCIMQIRVGLSNVGFHIMSEV